MKAVDSKDDLASSGQNRESADQAEPARGNLANGPICADSDTQRLDHFIARVEQSGWSTPCILLLHMIEPFETIASQLLLLFVPFISGAGSLADIIQDREKMDYLRTRLDARSTDHSEEE